MDQLTMFGGLAPAGARTVSLATIQARLADLAGAALTSVATGQEDPRKVWLRDHAGQLVTVLSRNGMQLTVQAEDRTGAIALTTEVEEL